MTFLADYVLDQALSKLDLEATRLDVCSSEPTTYAEATSTYSLGSKTSLVIGSPADGPVNGRQVAVAPFSDGSISGSGTAAYWAISDVANSRLLAANAISPTQAVTAGQVFEFPEFIILIGDAENYTPPSGVSAFAMDWGTGSQMEWGTGNEVTWGA
jgi:hypothetical protein